MAQANHISDKEKDAIDKMSLYSMLRKNRFEPSGSGYFSGERGEYFLKVMSEKRAKDPDGWVQASKDIGW